MNNTYLLIGLGGVFAVGFFMMKDNKSIITPGALIKARDFIKDKEGYRTKTYLDTAGLPTIGYGHLLKNGESYPSGITQKQAIDLLEKDLKIAENIVNKYVKSDINTNQKAALISFAYNVGEGNFKKSTLLTFLNQQLYGKAANEFDKWIYSGGKVTNGLVSRRKEEKRLFLA